MRKFIEVFFPLGTKRRKVLYYMKHWLKKTIFENKKKKSTQIHHEKWTENLSPQKGEYIVFDKKNNYYYLSKPMEHINKKIAVHLHLFYEDLLPEFITYLNHIPFPFDLYCSTNEENNLSKIEDMLKKIKKIQKIIVKVTPNIGRDFAPMVCAFGSYLKKYDYICHIHTKKSLRTGISQDGWRIHLLKGVLGNETLIKNIFSLFEKENVGIYFPDSYAQAPYWGNTWLGAKSLGRKYLNILGIPFEDKYQDFSVGSMFWLKTKAAKQIFNRNWKWEEFGEELGQEDGTLAYVFERLFVLCSNFNQYDFICFNSNHNIFYKNYSERNITQYYAKNTSNILENVSKYDIISFDIFDTLLTRKIYNPDDLFRLMDLKIKGKVTLKKDFFTIRKESENSLRNNNCDPDIDEIYNNMKYMHHLSEKDTLFLKTLELELEEKFLIPRTEILSLFNKIKNLNKKIIIVSDMYLKSSFLSKILEKNGYVGYDEIFVSCEINKRKDRGDIWNYIKNKYPNQKIMHIGDNEESDCHMLWQHNIFPEHIMSGKRMFENSSLSYKFDSTESSLNEKVYQSVLYGLILNKTLFNNPFKWNKSNGNYVVENLYEYGYAIIGPILFTFMVWLINSLRSEKNKTILFLAREGYYFEKMFYYLKEHCNCPWLDSLETKYFLTSRRCSSVACIESKEDIYELLNIEYYGDLYSLVQTRFNLKVKEKNFKIRIDGTKNDDKDKVISILKNYEKEILENAKKERKNYLKYISKNVSNLDEIIVVDLGYSGTIQTYLSKLLNTKVSGKYLVVKNNPKPLNIGCKVESCFNKLQNDNKHPIYKNSLLLEFFLTAPNGQLKFFDENGKPVYMKEKLVHEKMKYLDEIYAGVIDLFSDFIGIIGNNIGEYEFNKETITCFFEGFLFEADHFLNNNRIVFQFEDYYCRKDIMTLEKLK